MDRRRFLIGGVIGVGVALYWAFGRNRGTGDYRTDENIDVERSGESFPLGDLFVIIDYGFTDGGDRLRYMVIRSFPATSAVKERLADPRYDINPGGLPLVRQSDGKMRATDIDGRVYLYIGAELRTMRVRMNEHTDTVELRRAGSLQGMWDYLQRFRIADKN